MIVSGLKCEYLRDPVGIGDRSPRLMWRCSCNQGNVQEAYRVRVFRSGDSGDSICVWDSKTIESKSCFADYSGDELRSMEAYHWTVDVFDTSGRSVSDLPELINRFGKQRFAFGSHSPILDYLSGRLRIESMNDSEADEPTKELLRSGNAIRLIRL